MKNVEYVDEFIASLKVAEKPDMFGDLTIFPVFSARAKDNGYAVLDEALKSGKFTVTEVSDGGTVPHLKVLNDYMDVLLLDSDILSGGKQTRVVNTSMIIGLGEHVIDVSCVEKSRWNYRKRTFSSSKSALYSDIRRAKARSVSESLKTSKRFSSDQTEVWNLIDEKAQRLRVSSSTNSAEDIYENYEEKLKSYESSFHYRKNQAGFIAIIGGRVVGADIFGSRGILKKKYKNLLRSYVLDAIDYAQAGKKETPSAEETRKNVELFIKSLMKKEKTDNPSVSGTGSDVRIEGNDNYGFAIVRDEDVVHLAAFAEA